MTGATRRDAESVPRLVPLASVARSGQGMAGGRQPRRRGTILEIPVTGARSRREGAPPMSTATDSERELIFASFEDAAMGAVAEKALREWERQVESITLGN